MGLDRLVVDDVLVVRSGGVDEARAASVAIGAHDEFDQRFTEGGVVLVVGGCWELWAVCCGGREIKEWSLKRNRALSTRSQIQKINLFQFKFKRCDSFQIRKMKLFSDLKNTGFFLDK